MKKPRRGRLQQDPQVDVVGVDPVDAQVLQEQPLGGGPGGPAEDLEAEAVEELDDEP